MEGRVPGMRLARMNEIKKTYLIGEKKIKGMNEIKEWENECIKYKGRHLKKEKESEKFERWRNNGKQNERMMKEKKSVI